MEINTLSFIRQASTLKVRVRQPILFTICPLTYRNPQLAMRHNRRPCVHLIAAPCPRPPCPHIPQLHQAFPLLFPPFHSCPDDSRFVPLRPSSPPQHRPWSPRRRSSSLDPMRRMCRLPPTLVLKFVTAMLECALKEGTFAAPATYAAWP